MGDESTQAKGSEDSNEAKIVLLNQILDEVSSVNQVLQTENLEKVKQIEAAERVVTCLIGENDKLKLHVKTLEEENESNLSRIHEYDRIIDYLQDQLTSTEEKNDRLTSICEEYNNLRLINSLLTKRLQKNKEDLSGLEKTANDFIGQIPEIEDMKLENEKLTLQNEKLESELKNVKLENEELKSELKIVKLQKESSPSEVDKLMVLYRCSEREKHIACMKLLDVEENMRRLRNELRCLHNFMASQNETGRHGKKSNEENVQALELADLDVESEVTDIARALTSIKNENFVHTLRANESEKSETSITQSIEKDVRFSLEEKLCAIGEVDEFCKKFEEKFEEKKSCLITKLTSCDDQIQVLKKGCMKIKKEKLMLLDVMKEINGFLPNYREQLEHIEGELAKGAEEASILRRKTGDFEMKVKSLQEFTREH